jgi:hypothetical protein
MSYHPRLRRDQYGKRIRELPCLLLLAALYACNGGADAAVITLRVEGVVSDSEHGSPLGGARVSLGHWVGLTDSRVVKTTQTDAQGRYFLEHPCSGGGFIVDPALDRVDFIAAWTEGYEGRTYDRYMSEPKLLCTNELQTLDFSLRPRPSAP